MNVSPGFDVMRTLIQSERHAVPPVTAERSPPASRITRRPSPVIADSSTEAALNHLPVAGNEFASGDHHDVVRRSLGAGTSSVRPSGRNWRPMVSVFALRSVSACALPRPSAIASAKLAKHGGQSHRVICSSKPMELLHDVSNEQGRRQHRRLRRRTSRVPSSRSGSA